MGLIDKLLDKLTKGVRTNRVDKTLHRLIKVNPDLAPIVKKHRDSYEEFRKEVEKTVKNRKYK